jgi:hypothetical protein
MVTLLLVAVCCFMPISAVIMFLLLPQPKTNAPIFLRMAGLAITGVVIFTLAFIGLRWIPIFEYQSSLALIAIIVLILLMPAFNYRYTASAVVAIKIWMIQIFLLPLIPLGFWIFYASYPDSYALIAIIALILLIPIFYYQYAVSAVSTIKIRVLLIGLLLLTPIVLWILYTLFDYVVTFKSL